MRRMTLPRREHVHPLVREALRAERTSSGQPPHVQGAWSGLIAERPLNDELSRSGPCDRFASAINIFAMPNFNHPYQKLLILNGIYNSVRALANTISLLGG